MNEERKNRLNLKDGNVEVIDNKYNTRLEATSHSKYMDQLTKNLNFDLKLKKVEVYGNIFLTGLLGVGGLYGVVKGVELFSKLKIFFKL